MENNDEPVPSAPATVGAPMTFTPVVIAIFGAVVLLGVALKNRSDNLTRNKQASAVRAEVAAKTTALGDYRGHMQNLRWRAGKIHEWTDAQITEAEKSWGKQRARLFDALVLRCDQSGQEWDLAILSEKIEQLCAESRFVEARALASQVPVISFPSPTEFLKLQRDCYLGPLAATSRQTPATYRVFQQQEPEAAKEDIAALRTKLAAEDLDTVSVQQMLEVELLSAVVPADDPVLADWAALAAAADYFENADGGVLAHWRSAKRAIRLQEWQTAAAHMQSILRTTVRTRQPFRAAYGRTLMKCGPEQKGEAYPYLEEAAAAGDREARAWVTEEDVAQGRYAEALRRLEVAVVDGETGSVPQLLKLYAMDAAVVTRDAAREAGVLQRIVSAPDAPPNADLLLGRLYESGQSVPASAAKAFACYSRAAEKGHVPAWPEVARCCLRGTGIAKDDGQALEWAARAFVAGARERSVPILIELMESEPEKATGAVQAMFECENVAAGKGYQESRVEVPGESRLRTLLAKRLDQMGQFGAAARFYGAAAKSDPAVARRRAELTLSHPCETCGGTGKIQVEMPCPTCGSKGEIPCGLCGGRGYTLSPGPPPCPTCGGAGTVLQEGRRVKCSACDGTGRGHDSVTRKDCTACKHGQVPCPDCTGGKRKIPKECPDCHGAGHWALTDRGAP